MKKSWIFVLLIVVLAMSAVAVSAQEPTKLTLILRGGTYGDVIKAALPEFEAANNVKIEVLDLAFADLHDKIALDAPNEKGAYDLVMVDGSWMAEFSENGVLANLTDLGYAYDEDIITETTAAGIGADGNTYLIPYFGNVNIFLYNKALLESAGYTDVAELDSWEDVMKIATTVNEAGKPGYLLRAQAGDNIVSDFLSVLLANGGWVLDKDNNVTINTPEFKAALNQYIELLKVGKILDKDDIVAAIDTGEGAMALGWPGWYVPAVDGAASYTVIPTKLTEDSEPVSTSIYGVWFIGMAANSQNKDITLKLMEYLTSPEIQLASVQIGGVPCRHSVLGNADVLAKYPHLAIVHEALQHGVYRPLIKQWTDFTLALGAELDNAVQGVKDVDTALADAQVACEMVMMQ